MSESVLVIWRRSPPAQRRVARSGRDRMNPMTTLRTGGWMRYRVRRIPSMVIPSPGAVWPARVRSPSVMVTWPRMTPLTSKTTMRGPFHLAGGLKAPRALGVQVRHLDDASAASAGGGGTEPLGAREGRELVPPARRLRTDRHQRRSQTRDRRKAHLNSSAENRIRTSRPGQTARTASDRAGIGALPSCRHGRQGGPPAAVPYYLSSVPVCRWPAIRSAPRDGR